MLANTDEAVQPGVVDQAFVGEGAGGYGIQAFLVAVSSGIAVLPVVAMGPHKHLGSDV